MNAGLKCGLAAVVAASVLHVARADAGGCTMDVDCKGERICVEGVCVDPPEHAPPAQAQPPRAPAPIPTPTPVAPPPPPAPPPSTVQLAVDAPSGVTVSVAGTTCTTPCVLNVPPGEHHDGLVEGSGPFDVHVEHDSKLKLERQGAGTAIAGGVLAAIGIPMLIGGTLWFQAREADHDKCTSAGTNSDKCNDAYGPVLPGFVIGGGGLLTVFGGMFLIGGIARLGKFNPPTVQAAKIDFTPTKSGGVANARFAF